MELQLRPYQTEIIESLFDADKRGVKRPLVVLPTGAGKTATAISFAKEYHQALPGRRILWLTHRDELVQQTLRSIEIWWHDHPEIGIVKAEQNDYMAPFVVASVQTLGRENRRRPLIDHADFALVISDEHHFSPAPVWSNVLTALGCGEPNGPLMVGLTATPNRADGVGLKATTDEIVADYDILWGIANGFLVPPKGITVDINLAGVKMSRGDYQSGSLGDALEMENAHVIVAELIRDHAADRKTIVFTPTVNFAELVKDACKSLGFGAEMVSGTTLTEDRREIYARLKSGKTQIVVNCAVLIEGFDEPSVDCIVMARPTKSQTLFTQAVGRGLRIFPGKTDCMVIALAGTERHKLVTLASLAGRDYETEAKRQERTSDEPYDLFDSVQDIIRKRQEFRDKYVARPREIDLLGAKVRKETAWAVVSPATFAKRLPAQKGETRGRVLIWKQQSEDSWKVIMAKEDEKYQPHYTNLLNGVDFDTAQGFANDQIKKYFTHDAFIDPNAPWRTAPATPRQIEMLVKLHIPHNSVTVTKGEASDLLDVNFLRKIATKA